MQPSSVLLVDAGVVRSTAAIFDQAALVGSVAVLNERRIEVLNERAS